jgi:hypothetical protein
MNERCIVVEGPERRGDAAFIGAWLTAAAKVQALWREAKTDADFAERIRLVTDSWESSLAHPGFATAAYGFVMQLHDDATSFVVDISTEDGGAFVMMAHMGFFVRDGDHYRMAIPSELTLSQVRAAAFAFAATETDGEEGCYLRPEQLVSGAMSLTEAKAKQRRMKAIHYFNENIEWNERLTE